jgi:integrase
MPRQSRGPYLYLRKERRGPDGKVKEYANWVIRDGRDVTSTGCLQGETERAQACLAAYIQGKHAPERRERDIEAIDVADVLAVYDDDKREGMANKDKHDERMLRLNAWWGGKVLSDVTGVTCRAYAKTRETPGGARRDLEDLRAAINHHAKEGLHRGIVGVWLPTKGDAKERWLTRGEAARLLWVCWRARNMQRREYGNIDAPKLPTEKRPLRHIARFILLGLYTGTRASAIAAASPSRGDGKGYVDLERGIFYRLAGGQRATAKRQPPVPLPPHLLAHLRRWARPVDGKTPEHFIEWHGKQVASVKTGFKRAVKLAGLGADVTPHTLRHTAATWLMQAGVPVWEAAGFLGMSPELVEKTYGHHHPDHLAGAANAMSKAREKRKAA